MEPSERPTENWLPSWENRVASMSLPTLKVLTGVSTFVIEMGDSEIYEIILNENVFQSETKINLNLKTKIHL